MGLLDMRFERYPKSWSETSYDCKMMFVYHLSMMALMILGGLLSVAFEATIAAGLMAAGTVLGIRHRRTTPWVWPGLSVSRLLGAAATLLLGVLFFAAGIPLFPPTSAVALPWYLAGLGLILFSTLNTLQLVAYAEADYVEPPAPRVSTEPIWKRAVRLVYLGFFLVVWLDGVASFYYFGTTFRGGSATRTATQSEPLRNHAAVVYVEPSKKQLVDTLQRGMSVGIPVAMLLGAILHFIIGIKLFPNAPTLQEWRQRRGRDQ